MIVTIVAAIGRGGAIGKGGALPWSLPEDMRHFKTVTAGHVVIMGRRTWDSIPPKFRPLPGRTNIVMSRGADVDGAHYTAPSFHAAMLEAGQFGLPIDIIGGAEVYREALPFVDRLEVTEVDVEVPDADAWFPGVYPELLRETHGRHVLDPSPLDPCGPRAVTLCGRPFSVTQTRPAETPGLRFVTWEGARASW